MVAAALLCVTFSFSPAKATGYLKDTESCGLKVGSLRPPKNTHTHTHNVTANSIDFNVESQEVSLLKSGQTSSSPN